MVWRKGNRDGRVRGRVFKLPYTNITRASAPDQHHVTVPRVEVAFEIDAIWVRNGFRLFEQVRAEAC
jgi:hypothetical protein